MAANPQSWVDYFRTIVWIDTLIETLGVGHTALDRVYFEKYVSGSVGADEPPGESDRRFFRYFEGKHVPRPDPVINQNPDCGGWQLKIDPLRAMELEAPGSARWFFLPLFNLLDGRIQSSKAFQERMARIDVVGKLFDHVLGMLAAECKRKFRADGPAFAKPLCLTDRRYEKAALSIRMVREELLRLDDDIVDVLFHRNGDQFYRRPSEVSYEVNFLLKEVSINRLTAAIGLYLEAELLDSVGRIQPIAELIEFQLSSLDQELNFKRVARQLALVVRMGFGSQVLAGYCRNEAEINAFPASWAPYLRSVL